MRWLGTQENVDSPDSEYIYGRIRDWSGTIEGTPVNEALYGDIHQFIARMMQESGITPNNLPDNDYNGFQIYEAFRALTINPIVVETGDWDMQSSSFVIVTHGLPDFKKVRGVQVIVRDDPDAAYSPITLGGGVSTISSTTLTINRDSGGSFDNVQYNGTGFNRGWVLIHYDS